jgi:preprotein translocase subunit SecE
MGSAIWTDGRIPILGVVVTPALLIAAIVFGGAVLLLYRWTESPKIADALIETESELRKVTWPTLNEAMGSSVVVIVTVLVLMSILAGADFVLGWWAEKVLTGGAA